MQLYLATAEICDTKFTSGVYSTPEKAVKALALDHDRYPVDSAEWMEDSFGTLIGSAPGIKLYIEPYSLDASPLDDSTI